MGGLHVYFDDETSAIITKMPTGTLSKVCQQAVREWNNSVEDTEFIKKKITLLDEELNTKNAQRNFLVERYANLKNQEDETKKEKAKEAVKDTKAEQEEEQKRKQRVYEAYIKTLRDLFIVEDCKIEEIVNEYLAYKEGKLEFIGFAQYLDSKGLQRKAKPKRIEFTIEPVKEEKKDG